MKKKIDAQAVCVVLFALVGFVIVIVAQ